MTAHPPLPKLERLRTLHDKGLLHRDVKPENFVIGRDSSGQVIVYMIDLAFGKFYSPEGIHIPMRRTGVIFGTTAFSSIRGHTDVTLSRRDDLESLGYTSLYFVSGGNLPWKGMEMSNLGTAYSKTEALPNMCQNLPAAFQEFVEYSRGMDFTERPDYDRWIQAFADERSSHSGPDLSSWECHLPTFGPV